MAGPLGLFGKFLGRTVSEAAAFSAGVALGPVLGPPVQAIRNEVNSQYAFVYPEAGTLANGVAQGQVNEKDARLWASYHGIGDDAFTALVSIANTGPGVPAAFDLWRRGVITEAGFRRAAKRQGIEKEWVDGLVKTKTELLTPGELAAAIHRGLVPDPGILKGEQPDGPRNVESYPVFPIPTVDEAAGSGIDPDRLGVLVGLQGLPMGPHEAAQALFRGIITHGDYIAAFNESNSRNEWAQAVLEQSRQIPTARDFFENALRGYHEFDWALEQAKRHGMSEEDATVIYQNQGRPMALKQITQALARGGVFKPEPGELTDPYDASIVEGSIKPAYYDLAKALRYTYPSAFALRGLVASKAITEAEARDVLLYEGWEPGFAGKVAKAWANTKTAAAKEATASDELTLYDGFQIDRAELIRRLGALGYPEAEANRKADVLDARRVVSARGTATSGVHGAFKKHTATEAEARAALVKLGVAEWAREHVIAAWIAERDVSRPELTPAQVVSAYRRAIITRAQALAELEARGFAAVAAGELLDTAAVTLTDKQITDAVDAGVLTRDEGLQRLMQNGHSAADAAVLLPPPPPPPVA